MNLRDKKISNKELVSLKLRSGWIPTDANRPHHTRAASIDRRTSTRVTSLKRVLPKAGLQKITKDTKTEFLNKR